MQLFNFPELSSGNVNRKEMTLELEVVSQASTGLQSRIKELEKEYGVDSKISIVEGYESAELPLAEEPTDNNNAFAEQVKEQLGKEGYTSITVAGSRITIGVPSVESIEKIEVLRQTFEEQEELETFPVKEIEDCFVAGRKFIQYKNKMLDLQELEKLPLICLEKNTSTRACMDRFLYQNHVEMHPEFELATSDMIVQFALRNLGVGCVMREFAKEQLESGRLFELRFNKIIPRRHICVLTEKRKPLSKAAEGLFEMLQKDF